jgi:uncharacterized protein
MTKILPIKFDAENITNIKSLKFGEKWPVVYVLENGTEAYIGETTDAYHRFKQHYEREDRRKLNKAYLIGDAEYNKSATLDIESLLIQYMSADGVYKLQNGNGGLANHQYYEKEKYVAKFELIWKQLKSLSLARHDLIQLRNSDIFKYSPYKALTEEQIEIVNSLFENIITRSGDTFIIHGEPGTGKTVVGVYLMKYLIEQEETKGLKMAMVVPMVGLRTTLKKVFTRVKGLSARMVIGPSEVVGRDYDLLIVDEAHRLKRRVNLTNFKPFDDNNRKLGLGKEGTELDWIMASSKFKVLFYDERQTVRPGDIRHDQIQQLTALEYKLVSQLRVLGGEDYLRFVDDLWNLQPTKPYQSTKFEFKVCDSIQELESLIAEKEKHHGLARMVAGYAWPWVSKKDNATQDYDIAIDGQRFKWNSTNIDWINSQNAAKEVGCIHTVQGYDLNYVGVIIGPEVSFDTVRRKLIIDRDKYMDFNGKRSISEPEELERYIINIYKTLMTRGIKGCYIYCVNKDLERYILSCIK